MRARGRKERKILDTPVPGPSPRTISLVNKAYLCFAFCGVVATVGPPIFIRYVKGQDAVAIGMLFGLPLGLLAIVAMGCGILFSLICWRHWPLLLVSTVSALFITEILTEAGSAGLYKASPWIYGVIVTAFCAGRLIHVRFHKPLRPDSDS